MEYNESQQFNSNPLVRHFRQPSIYISLPSLGKYWAPGALSMPANGEIGVMPMTTKDEIILKTPDALLNGQGVVNVIESCCPNVHDAWAMPSIDVDATLIAIRIASYGEQMDFKSQCPACGETHEYAINLGALLSTIKIPQYSEKLEFDQLTFKFKPPAYYEFNRSNMISFEEQQILRSIENIENDPEEAKAKFDLHLSKVIELNVNMLASSTEYIETGDGVLVSDPAYIHEFYANSENKVIKAVQDHLTRISKDTGIQPVEVTCLTEDCNTKFPVTILFDYASFFEIGS